MSSWDDDDWQGTPPEGRHSRDRANPGFWTGRRPLVVSLFSVAMFALVIVVLLLAF